MNQILEQLGTYGIVPVVVLQDAAKAEPLAEALRKGGLACAEVTFRTDAAEESIAGHWHRQVSLLSYEKIEAFRAKGADIPLGAFGENLIVEGYDFRNLPVGTRFSCGDALLEMTQIGKECHCEIFKRMGECIMPREGVFAVVLRGGTIQKGDTIELVTEK